MFRSDELCWGPFGVVDFFDLKSKGAALTVRAGRDPGARRPGKI